jgi:hypothetical protein
MSIIILRVLISNYIRDMRLVLLCGAILTSSNSLLYPTLFHHLKLKAKVAWHVNMVGVDNTIGENYGRPLEISLTITRLDVLKGKSVGLRLTELSIKGLFLEN